MPNRRFNRIATWMAVAALLLTTHAQAQTTGGLRGFFQKAGATVSHAASSVFVSGNPSATSGQVAGPATTTGAYYRPLHPSTPGAIVGIFDGHRMGDAWPRVAVRFTQAGADRACWRAEATIWRSATNHIIETFDVCNAPLAFTDAMGRQQFMTAPEDDFNGGQGRVAINTAQNIQGMSHADTAPGDVRNAGPLPPHMLFYLGQGSESGPLAHQYHEILVRLMWLTGWMNHANPVLDVRSGKILWVIGLNSGATNAQEPTP
ncbi:MULTISPECIES: hypothetical protein [unclassified Luteibacter]|uniref:hypothetical protein n=1 Tax=Luteibacter sp. PvP019 TaxID=3156436 RepID=UPI003395D321